MIGKALVACEESQAVCIELRRKGWEAYSCDILPCSGGQPEWHIQGDVRNVLTQYWDLVIAHPPCTCLTAAGQWYYKSKPDLVKEAVDFFMLFANYKGLIAIENPAGIMSTRWRKADQFVHPYYFGEPHMKRTGFWLKGLPKLKHPRSKNFRKTATYLYRQVRKEKIFYRRYFRR